MEAAITVEELAKRFDKHPNTIRALANNGDIPAMRVGRDFRFYASEVEKSFRESVKKPLRKSGKKKV